MFWAGPQDGNGSGRPGGSLTRPKILWPMGHAGRPQTRFGPVEPAPSAPLGQQGRPTLQSHILWLMRRRPTDLFRVSGVASGHGPSPSLSSLILRPVLVAS
jgi:hypothetical protein